MCRAILPYRRVLPHSCTGTVRYSSAIYRHGSEFYRTGLSTPATHSTGAHPPATVLSPRFSRVLGEGRSGKRPWRRSAGCSIRKGSCAKTHAKVNIYFFHTFCMRVNMKVNLSCESYDSRTRSNGPEPRRDEFAQIQRVPGHQVITRLDGMGGGRSPQVVPDLRTLGVELQRPRIGIERCSG
jgi:hypothetical protein